MKEKIEQFGPVAVAAIIVGAYYFGCPHHGLPKATKDLLSAVINISAIFVGFFGAIWSILIGIEDRPIMKQLKSAGADHKLFDFLNSSIRWSFALAVISVCMLFVDLENTKPWHYYLFLGWFYVLTTTILVCLRIFRLFTRVLRFPKDGDR